MDVLQEQTLSDGYTQITAYPTSDLFTWKLVERDGKGRYRYYTYNNLENRSSEVKEVNNLTIINGSYSSAQEAIKIADNLPEVRKFKWNSYFTILSADYNSTNWIINYSNFMGAPWSPENLTVTVPNN